MVDRYYGALVVYFFNLISRQKVAAVSTVGSQIRTPIRIGVIGANLARGWGTAAVVVRVTRRLFTRTG
jgi:hypothetical protein